MIGVIATSLYGNRTSVIWALQLATFIKPCDVEFAVSARKPVEAGRNDIVRQFLKTDCDYLLFIDTDVIMSSDAVVKLWKERDNFDIVSGLYFKKGSNHTPVAYDTTKIDDDGIMQWRVISNWDGKSVIPVEAVGMGICLIPRAVFEKLEKPYFKMDLMDIGSSEKYSPLGEDIYFCKKVRDKGITIGLHTGCQCYHVREDAVIHNMKYIN